MSILRSVGVIIPFLTLVLSYKSYEGYKVNHTTISSFVSIKIPRFWGLMFLTESRLIYFTMLWSMIILTFGGSQHQVWEIIMSLMWKHDEKTLSCQVREQIWWWLVTSCPMFSPGWRPTTLVTLSWSTMFRSWSHLTCTGVNMSPVTGQIHYKTYMS